MSKQQDLPPAFLSGRPRVLNWTRFLENFLPHTQPSKQPNLTIVANKRKNQPRSGSRGCYKMIEDVVNTNKATDSK